MQLAFMTIINKGKRQKMSSELSSNSARSAADSAQDKSTKSNISEITNLIDLDSSQLSQEQSIIDRISEICKSSGTSRASLPDCLSALPGSGTSQFVAERDRSPDDLRSVSAPKQTRQSLPILDFETNTRTDMKSANSASFVVPNHSCEQPESLECDRKGRIQIYEQIIKNSNTRYIVTNIHDMDTDMTISNESLRNDILKLYPELIDLSLKDAIFDATLHDMYINFFYSSYSTHRSENDKKLLKSKYKEICMSEQFRSFYFALIGIQDDIHLQERYLSQIHQKMSRKLNVTMTYSEKMIERNSNKQVLFESIARNYLNILKTGKYKKVAKYINGEPTNIYISNPHVRKQLFRLIDDYKLEYPDFDVVCIFEFEERTIPVIARIIIDNFIRNKVSTINRKKCKYQCEKLIYNNHECTKMIQHALGEYSSLSYDYMNIIINSIVTILLNEHVS